MDITLSSLLGGLQLGSATPQPLGTAGAGSSSFAARQDHVHAMPTAAAVGADPAGTGASQAAAAIAAHLLAADPHSQYLTPAEGNAAYEAIGAAAAAIAAHVVAADPHTQYLTQAEADALYAPAGPSGSSAPDFILQSYGVT